MKNVDLIRKHAGPFAARYLHSRPSLKKLVDVDDVISEVYLRLLGKDDEDVGPGLIVHVARLALIDLFRKELGTRRKAQPAMMRSDIYIHDFDIPEESPLATFKSDLLQRLLDIMRRSEASFLQAKVQIARDDDVSVKTIERRLRDVARRYKESRR